MPEPIQPEQPAIYYDAPQAEVGPSGVDRWLEDTRREINLDPYYIPHAKQQMFHESKASHRLLGGAAGPGKSLAGIMDHLAGVYTFSDPIEAVQVHTLLLRRTHPQLEQALVTRFREKVPKELYRDYNEQKKVVTWLNGATSQFGSMQYEHDVWNYQGTQWWKVFYDELTQFTLYQWVMLGGWIRCPVDPFCTQDGGTNPIGVSASAFACLFGADGKGKRPAPTMDENQRAQYDPDDYEYIPCTYLDNPIYANDQQFIKKLDSYPGPIRDALKYGKWGALGTYFDIWDEAIHVYPFDTQTVEPYHPVWLGGDWGFAHNATTYWNTMDDRGQVRTFYEFVTDHEEPAQLAESIAREHATVEKMMGALSGRDNFRFKLEPWLFYSHDAFHEKTSPNTIARQMEAILRPQLGIQLINGGTDKMGGEQLMYSLLKQRIQVGTRPNPVTGEEISLEIPKWVVSDACPRLAAIMPQAPRDEKKPEQIAKFLGDDPIDGVRQAIYGKFSGKIKLPIEAQIAARVTSDDPTIRNMQAIKAEADIAKATSKDVVKPRRWRPPVR